MDVAVIVDDVAIRPVVSCCMCCAAVPATCCAFRCNDLVAVVVVVVVVVRVVGSAVSLALAAAVLRRCQSTRVHLSVSPSPVPTAAAPVVAVAEHDCVVVVVRVVVVALVAVAVVVPSSVTPTRSTHVDDHGLIVVPFAGRCCGSCGCFVAVLCTVKHIQHFQCTYLSLVQVCTESKTVVHPRNCSFRCCSTCRVS